jgi:hypothetical protein
MSVPPWDREWFPTAAALAIGAAIVWLAGAPFEIRERPPRPALRLLEPAGELHEFPSRFAWTPVEGAAGYEISLTALAPEERLVFRQRGGSSVLDLDFDAGAEPGPGLYRWEVLALRGGSVAARGSAEFRVGPGP